LELCVTSAANGRIIAYNIVRIRWKKCEKFVHQALKYSATVLPHGEMRYQIFKIL